MRYATSPTTPSGSPFATNSASSSDKSLSRGGSVWTVVKRILKLYGLRARVLVSCLPNPRDGGRGSIRDASSEFRIHHTGTRKRPPVMRGWPRPMRLYSVYTEYCRTRNTAGRSSCLSLPSTHESGEERGAASAGETARDAAKPKGLAGARRRPYDFGPLREVASGARAVQARPRCAAALPQPQPLSQPQP